MGNQKIDDELIFPIFQLIREWGAAVAQGDSADEQISLLRGLAADEPATMREAFACGRKMHRDHLAHNRLPDNDIRHPQWSLISLDLLQKKLGL